MTKARKSRERKAYTNRQRHMTRTSLYDCIVSKRLKTTETLGGEWQVHKQSGIPASALHRFVAFKEQHPYLLHTLIIV
jgi:hypothetical protein